jgi:hypothetical protein
LIHRPSEEIIRIHLIIISVNERKFSFVDLRRLGWQRKVEARQSFGDFRACEELQVL